MARKGVAEFGNLVVTYGEGDKAKGLLDHPEFFFPTIFDASPRETIHGTYLILHPTFVTVGDDDAIAFEFVKVQDMKSEQELVRGDIQRKQRVIQNDAPSAVGVLVLRSHRLVYVGKTAGSPSAKQFAQSIRVGIKGLYDQHLRHLRLLDPDADDVSPVAKFTATTPRPTVEYVPIIGKDNIADALKGFKKVQFVSLDVLAPNPDEIKLGNSVLQNLRKLRQNAGAKTTRLQHTNPDGLDRAAVQKQLEAAAEDDLTKTKVVGINQHDNEETWKDSKLSLHVAVNVDLTTVKRAAKPLIDTMNTELAHLPPRVAHAPVVRKALDWYRDWIGRR